MPLSRKKYKFLCLTLAALAMALSISAKLAPVWLKTPDGNAQTIICSAFGTRTITIDKNGREVPNRPQMNRPCAMCLVSHAAINMPPISGVTPPLIRTQPLLFTAYTPNTPSSLRFKAHVIRAPPPLS